MCYMKPEELINIKGELIVCNHKVHHLGKPGWHLETKPKETLTWNGIQWTTKTLEELV